MKLTTLLTQLLLLPIALANPSVDFSSSISPRWSWWPFSKPEQSHCKDIVVLNLILSIPEPPVKPLVKDCEKLRDTLKWDNGIIIDNHGTAVVAEYGTCAVSLILKQRSYPVMVGKKDLKNILDKVIHLALAQGQLLTWAVGNIYCLAYGFDKTYEKVEFLVKVPKGGYWS